MCQSLCQELCLLNLVLTVALWKRNPYSHLMHKDNETQRELVNCPRSHNWQRAEPWFESAKSNSGHIPCFLFVCFFVFWPHHAGILVPWPGIAPMPLAVGARSLNHRTAREVPQGTSLDSPSLVIFIHMANFYTVPLLGLNFSTDSSWKSFLIPPD